MVYRMAFKFEKLIVWQRALELANSVHLLTRSFPKEELYILTSQIKRAADSLVLNIAEGPNVHTEKEFARFLTVANRSALEVVACLHLAKKRNLISSEHFDNYYSELTEIVKMIQGLKKSVLKISMD